MSRLRKNNQPVRISLIICLFPFTFGKIVKVYPIALKNCTYKFLYTNAFILIAFSLNTNGANIFK
jgi:hypothetical protein